MQRLHGVWGSFVIGMSLKVLCQSLSLSLPPPFQAAKTLRKSGGGEAGEGGEDDASSESTEPAQTLLEIDYDTVIDDEDVIDEFGLFKNLLEGKKKYQTRWLCLNSL